MRLLASALVATTVLAFPALAQEAGGPDGAPTTPNAPVATASQTLVALDPREETFLHEMAATGLAAVAFGRLAEQNAGGAAVKAFGRLMVEEHSKADDRLAALVLHSNVALSATMSDPYQKTFAELKKLKGAAFDSVYLSGQMDDHEKMIQLLEDEATAGKESRLKAFAADMLPTAKSHLDMALSMQTSVQMSRR